MNNSITLPLICNECGSTNLSSEGNRTYTNSAVVKRIICSDCGTRRTIPSESYEKLRKKPICPNCRSSNIETLGKIDAKYNYKCKDCNTEYSYSPYNWNNTLPVCKRCGKNTALLKRPGKNSKSYYCTICIKNYKNTLKAKQDLKITCSICHSDNITDYKKIDNGKSSAFCLTCNNPFFINILRCPRCSSTTLLCKHKTPRYELYLCESCDQVSKYIQNRMIELDVKTILNKDYDKVKRWTSEKINDLKFRYALLDRFITNTGRYNDLKCWLNNATAEEETHGGSIRVDLLSSGVSTDSDIYAIIISSSEDGTFVLIGRERNIIKAFFEYLEEKEYYILFVYDLPLFEILRYKSDLLRIKMPKINEISARVGGVHNLRDRVGNPYKSHNTRMKSLVNHLNLFLEKNEKIDLKKSKNFKQNDGYYKLELNERQLKNVFANSDKEKLFMELTERIRFINNIYYYSKEWV